MNLQRLGIDIVGGCQLKCVGCANSTLRRKIQFTTPEDFNRYLSNVDVKRIEFLKLYNFGEIFLHPNLGEMLNVIKKQKWSAKHVEISTNGQVLDRDKIKDVFKSGIVTRFGISADGDGTSKEYEKLRTGAKFNKLLEFMRFVKLVGCEINPKVKVFLKVICTGNKRKWKELAKKYGFDIQWKIWLKQPDSKKYVGTKRRKLHKVCHHVVSTKKRCYVDWDGSVVPCCNHPRAAVFGTLKTMKFSKIYYGNKRKRFINQLNNHRCEHTICGKCETK